MFAALSVGVALIVLVFDIVPAELLRRRGYRKLSSLVMLITMLAAVVVFAAGDRLW